MSLLGLGRLASRFLPKKKAPTQAPGTLFKIQGKLCFALFCFVLLCFACSANARCGGQRRERAQSTARIT